MALFINGKEKLFLLGVEVHLLLVGVEHQFGLVHEAQVFGVFEQLEQPFGSGLADLDTVEQQTDFLFGSVPVLGVRPVLRSSLANQWLGLGKETIAQPLLGVEERLDLGLKIG